MTCSNVWCDVNTPYKTFDMLNKIKRSYLVPTKLSASSTFLH